MTTLAMVVALLVLVPQHAEAKGPNQVEVHDEQSGETTLLTEDRDETWGLMELVADPSMAEEPRAVASGRLDLVATLEWQFPDGSAVWTDKVYSDGQGTTWVRRHDRLAEPATTRWGRVQQAVALDAVLTGLERDASTTTASVEDSATAPTAAPSAADDDGWDASSFGWGVGLAGVLAIALLLARRLRQRVVTASRNSRVS